MTRTMLPSDMALVEGGRVLEMAGEADGQPIGPAAKGTMMEVGTTSTATTQTGTGTTVHGTKAGTTKRQAAAARSRMVSHGMSGGRCWPRGTRQERRVAQTAHKGRANGPIVAHTIGVAVAATGTGTVAMVDMGVEETATCVRRVTRVMQTKNRKHMSKL